MCEPRMITTVRSCVVALACVLVLCSDSVARAQHYSPASPSSGYTPGVVSSSGEASVDAKAPKYKLPDQYTQRERLAQKERRSLKLPRVHLRDLDKPENHVFKTRQTPFVLLGALGNWPNIDFWNADYYMDMWGEQVMDWYPHNMPFRGVHPYLTKMSESLPELLHGIPHQKYHINSGEHMNKGGSYIQWNVDQPTWYDLQFDFGKIPEVFDEDLLWLEKCLPTESLRSEFFLKTHWRMVLIGNVGAGMFNHVDTIHTGAYQAQITGRKKWHLCPPSEDPYMYQAGDIDGFDPSYKQFPEFKKAVCYVDVVSKGEMVFYPKDWWHQTMSLDPLTTSIVGTVVDSVNYRAVEDSLRGECDHQALKYNFSRHLCDHLPKCWTMWEDLYGPAGTRRNLP
eukprot:GFYU01002633.1.p1 GENE.GFYU01002633.1~~GFYU01002633.1.p1  ORF type:complete len:396 (+),score=66.22 GFYU01002633.1:102-1289(+)